ncbi:hypothetical protein BKA69DRAFT_749603 [Paraphysoderma sedebokerense]|nr:hypothetical protein BKA69DRAFT_749603 [Paraphysoderma sedebokerense]
MLKYIFSIINLFLLLPIAHLAPSRHILNRRAWLLPDPIDSMSFLSNVAYRDVNNVWNLNLINRASYASVRNSFFSFLTIPAFEAFKCSGDDIDHPHADHIKSWFSKRGSDHRRYSLQLNDSRQSTFEYPFDTDANGISRHTFQYNGDQNELRDGYKQLVGPMAYGGVIQVIEREGWSIITDIDDTVKHTVVLDRTEALKNTFCKRFEVVPGMPELFKSLKSRLATNRSALHVHYVSGSPVFLGNPLQEFFSANYWLGGLDLRTFDLTDINFWEAHKLDAFARILSQFPVRKFLWIGDSGEKDPDTYGQAYRNLSEQQKNNIACIWIRKVPGADNSDERFMKDFDSVPVDKWYSFTDPAELLRLDVARGQCRP